MATSGMPISSGRSGQNPPLPKALNHNQSLQRNPSRRVLFSETPDPKHHPPRTGMAPKQHQARNQEDDSLSDVPTKRPWALDWDGDDFKKERRGRRLCCAWTSLIIGSLVLVLMLLGGLSLSFIKGALPEFRVKSLDISRLNVTKKDKQTLLNANVQLVINATNKNDRYDLSYSALTVDVSSEDIDLGTTKVAPIKQDPKKSTVLNVATEVKKLVVDDAAVEDLKSSYKDKQAEIDVVFKGRITVNMEGREISGLPLKVLCMGILQNEIDNGLQPRCRVKMFNIL